MDLKKALYATLTLIALSLVVSSAAWFVMPDRVATHFDASWQPNGYGKKGDVLMIGPGLMALTGLVSFGACAIAKDGIEESGIEPYLASFLVIVEVFLLGLGVFILGKAAGH